MSHYSLDSLERNDCPEETTESNRNSNEVTNLEQSGQSNITVKKDEPVSLNITKLSSPISDVLNETSGCSALSGSLVSSRNLIIAVDSFTKVEEKSRLDPRDNKDRNENVIRDGLCTTNVAAHQRKSREKEEEERVKKTLPLSTGCRKTFPRIVTPMGSMRHTKKLSGVAVERASWRMEENVRRSVSYLERYRRRTDALRNRRACSSEDSSLSICRDNSVERLTDVKSRGSSGFPRDDQSELSLYKGLMHQTSRSLETSRSCESFQDDGDDHLRNGDGSASSRNIDVRSTSEDKLNQQKFPGYRRYSLKDLKALSVPRRDRSLGPDPVEVWKKRERLMRHRLYGDSVSARNRQHILQEKVRSCKPESCDATQENLRGDAKDFRTKSVTSGVTLPSRKSRSGPGTCPSPLRGPRFLEPLHDPHLELLQERHFSEKKMIEQLVKRGSELF